MGGGIRDMSLWSWILACLGSNFGSFTIQCWKFLDHFVPQFLHLEMKMILRAYGWGVMTSVDKESEDHWGHREYSLCVPTVGFLIHGGIKNCSHRKPHVMCEHTCFPSDYLMEWHWVKSPWRSLACPGPLKTPSSCCSSVLSYFSVSELAPERSRDLSTPTGLQIRSEAWPPEPRVEASYLGLAALLDWGGCLYPS